MCGFKNFARALHVLLFLQSHHSEIPRSTPVNEQQNSTNSVENKLNMEDTSNGTDMDNTGVGGSTEGNKVQFEF